MLNHFHHKTKQRNLPGIIHPGLFQILLAVAGDQLAGSDDGDVVAHRLDFAQDMAGEDHRVVLAQLFNEGTDLQDLPVLR